VDYVTDISIFLRFELKISSTARQHKTAIKLYEKRIAIMIQGSDKGHQSPELVWIADGIILAVTYLKDQLNQA
jgi:hypothetical protein